MQIFTQSPRAWRPTNHPPENIERFKQAREEAGIGSVVCHAVYLINLATSDRVIWEKSRAALVQTVKVACAMEADGVVVPVGSHLGARLEAGLDQAAAPIGEAIAA